MNTFPELRFPPAVIPFLGTALICVQIGTFGRNCKKRCAFWECVVELLRHTHTRNCHPGSVETGMAYQTGVS